ncbi:GNAT family N-acetyltransferase [Collimonas arenae]|uniref:GNAT family N-acetyltransferase n=1 Tax=Collimonas arenae TaxID=279058 RepID=UPI00077833E9|nr:GNAT family N-acetyltransferase [Collimonas arenae]
MITFAMIDFDKESLNKYSNLFSECFPDASKFSFEYLKWLYCDNPNGRAIGFDAWDDDQLAAHYVCVPTRVKIRGRECNVLLSLNTATHPKYQGKGLFTKLAEMTYDAGASKGFDGIYGVANANSTPGFVRKLGFQLIEPLEARVGFGALNINMSNASDIQFERIWSESSISWRCNNPNNSVYSHEDEKSIKFSASAMGNGLPVYAELPKDCAQYKRNIKKNNILSPIRLFIGLTPTGTCSFGSYFNIPQRFRPSPLNFIYRSLLQDVAPLEQGTISFSFLDFDAY